MKNITCKWPRNAYTFIFLLEKELILPKRAHSGWNKTLIGHAQIPHNSQQAVKHRAEKLSQGLSKMKGWPLRGWLPTGASSLPASGCLSTLPRGQARQGLQLFPLVHSTSTPRSLRNQVLSPLGWVFLGKFISPSKYAVQGLGSSYFLAVQPGGSVSSPGKWKKWFHCDCCRGPRDDNWAVLCKWPEAPWAHCEHCGPLFFIFVFLV